MMPATIKKRIGAYMRRNPGWHSARTISIGAGITEDEFADVIDSMLDQGYIAQNPTLNVRFLYKWADESLGYRTTRGNRVYKYLSQRPGVWHTSTEIAKHLNLRPMQIGHVINTMPDLSHIEVDRTLPTHRYRWVK